MSDRCVVLHHGPTAVRVRREPFGCVMFDSPGVFVEGNETVWEVVECIAGGFTYDELVLRFAESYCLPLAMIDRDLRELFQDFRRYGWLTNFDIERREEL